MQSLAKFDLASAARGGTVTAASQPPGERGALASSAAPEFFSAVQLLAERARFVTGAVGVTIAVKESGRFVYCAASGILAAVVGDPADVTKEAVAQCIVRNRASQQHGDVANHQLARAVV